ncbi:MAG: HU family DNA-binding protein [Vulcanimicrobiota bacterium]
MNKKELIDRISKAGNLTKAQSRLVVEEVFKTITHTLVKGEKFQMVGFGSFHVKKRPARKGTNPRTGERIRIEAKKVPVFSPGKTLISAVNKAKK